MEYKLDCVAKKAQHGTLNIYQFLIGLQGYLIEGMPLLIYVN